MENTFDLKIIGGGIAGLSCGIHAQKLGLKSIIIEKDKLPKKKICGGLFTTKSKLLYEHLLEEPLKFKYKDDTVILKYKDKWVSSDIKPIYFVDRVEISKQMLNKYIQLGGIIAQIDNSKADRTIYANGVNFSQINNGNYAFAIEQEWDEDLITTEIEFLPEIKGYLWNFMTNIGIGGEVKYTKEILDKVKELNLTNIKGTYLPYGNPLKDRDKIGDRANLCSPITGEGIYYAIKSGILAAENKNHNSLVRKLKFEKVLVDFFYNHFDFCWKLLKINCIRKYFLYKFC